MSIPDSYRHNFRNMLRAASDGRLALLECRDRQAQAVTYVVVMVSDVQGDDGSFDLVPVARLFDANPYDELDPPDLDGGYVDACETGECVHVAGAEGRT
jgi:Family of unknown function (DUF6117)